MEITTCRFTIDAGCVVRGSIKRFILRQAFSLNIDVLVEEHKGFLESTYLFTTVGETQNIFRLVNSVKKLLED